MDNEKNMLSDGSERGVCIHMWMWILRRSMHFISRGKSSIVHDSIPWLFVCLCTVRCGHSNPWPHSNKNTSPIIPLFDNKSGLSYNLEQDLCIISEFQVMDSTKCSSNRNYNAMWSYMRCLCNSCIYGCCRKSISLMSSKGAGVVVAWDK